MPLGLTRELENVVVLEINDEAEWIPYKDTNWRLPLAARESFIDLGICLLSSYEMGRVQIPLSVTYGCVPRRTARAVDAAQINTLDYSVDGQMECHHFCGGQLARPGRIPITPKPPPIPWVGGK